MTHDEAEAEMAKIKESQVSGEPLHQWVDLRGLLQVLWDENEALTARVAALEAAAPPSG